MKYIVVVIVAFWSIKPVIFSEKKLLIILSKYFKEIQE